VPSLRAVYAASGPPIDNVSEQIRQRLTIWDLAERLSLTLRRKNPCESPFERQKTPSFSVYEDGKKFNDFSNSEHRGDVFDFYRIATGCDHKQAFLALKEIVFGTGSVAPIARAWVKRPEEKKEPVVRTFDVPTDAELEQLGKLRHIKPYALSEAVRRGLLRTGDAYGHRAWIVTDSSHWNHRARRLDGKPWDHTEARPKAICATGSRASWPIGIPEAKDYPCIALCEGEGDFLAAFQFLMDMFVENLVAPVCMAGASNRIPDDALPLFAGKRVRIFVHADRSGEEAAERWYGQLKTVAADVDGFEFGGLYMQDGSVITDLNDLLLIGDEYKEQNPGIIEATMDFATEERR
jgi:hypothetical protein